MEKARPGERKKIRSRQREKKRDRERTSRETEKEEENQRIIFGNLSEGPRNPFRCEETI